VPTWPYRLSARTSPFQGGKQGSIPCRVTRSQLTSVATGSRSFSSRRPSSTRPTPHRFLTRLTATERFPFPAMEGSEITPLHCKRTILSNVPCGGTACAFLGWLVGPSTSLSDGQLTSRNLPRLIGGSDTSDYRANRSSFGTNSFRVSRNRFAAGTVRFGPCQADRLTPRKSWMRSRGLPRIARLNRLDGRLQTRAVQRQVSLLGSTALLRFHRLSPGSTRGTKANGVFASVRQNGILYSRGNKNQARVEQKKEAVRGEDRHRKCDVSL